MRHTGYGGQKTLTAKVLQSKNYINSSKSSKGMLPKKNWCWTFRNLNVVVGSEHKQGAQNLKTVNLNDLK
jgi:large subunit ribosomal protein L13